jgi:hypothetical protein
MSEENSKEVGVTVEDGHVVVDITYLINNMKCDLMHAVESQVQPALLKAIEKIILEMAKKELRDIVGATLRELLTELKFKAPMEAPPKMGRVLPVPSGIQAERAAEALEKKEPVYELTLKEYLTLWMRGSSFSWGQRPRLWEMVERHIQDISREFVKEELQVHTEQVKEYLKSNAINELYEAFKRKLAG